MVHIWRVDHLRVGSRLSVMTAIRAPVDVMTGVGMVGVMTMMIGNRMTVAPRITAIGAPVGVMIDDRDVTKTDDARHRARH